MKVSETATPKSQDPIEKNGPASSVTLRGQQQQRGGKNKEANNGGRNGSSHSTSSSSPSQSARQEQRRSDDSKIKSEQRKNPAASVDQKDGPKKKEGKNGSASPEAKKPWIPCTRRPSKPKPLPDILDMLDSGKVCKKFQKMSPTNSASYDAEKIRRKQQINSETGTNNNAINADNNKSNGNGSIVEGLTSSNGNSNNNNNGVITSAPSMDRKVLKRQFGFDKAMTGGLKESNSDESLNSINSVTQLLKIERSAPYNNKRIEKDDDKEDKEEVLTGVKLIAARLEAKNNNANNSTSSSSYRNGLKNSGMNENGHFKSKDGDHDFGLAFNSKTISSHNQTNHHHQNEKKAREKADAEKDSIHSASVTATKLGDQPPQQEVNNVGTLQILAKSHTTGTGSAAAATAVSEATSSSSVLLNAAAAAAAASSLQQHGRKKANANKTSTSTPSSKSSYAQTSSSVSQSQVKTSRSASPEKRADPKPTSSSTQAINSNVISKLSIRSRSSSPVKFPKSPPSSSSVPSGGTEKAASTARQKTGSSSVQTTEANNKSSKKVASTFTAASAASASRSSSCTRKNSLASSNASSSSPPKTLPSSKHQSNQIKDKNNSTSQKEDATTTTTSAEKRLSRRRSNDNKSNLINPLNEPKGSLGLDNNSSREINGNRNGITDTDSSRRKSRKSDHIDHSASVSSVKRYALPTIASQQAIKASSNNNSSATAPPTNKTVAGVVVVGGSRRGSSSSSLSRETSRTRVGRKEAVEVEQQPKKDNKTICNKNCGNLIASEKKLTKEPCKLESNTGRNCNKSIVGGGGAAKSFSSSEDVLDYSLSSMSTPSASASASSSVSVTSSPSTSWRSRKKQFEQQRVIPSIIMSEYVVDVVGRGRDNANGKEVGSAAVLKHSQNLFTPLQIIEPLKPTCDIKEGDSLELTVRVRGAEAFVWVKENKLIPNAPPDFHYFSEKSTDSDLYGLRIADVFVEDSGLYIFEAYGGGNSEITCWCEVKVVEASEDDIDDGDDDDEDISWEDLDISEEVKTPQPLVVPVIVTSQAEQEREPTPTFEAYQSKEPSPVRAVPVKQVKRGIDESSVRRFSRENQHFPSEDSFDCSQLITTKRLSRKSSANNESALNNNNNCSVVNGTMKKSPKKAPAGMVKYGDGECASVIEERVTEFASETAPHKIPHKEVSSREDSGTTIPPVAILAPPPPPAEGEEAKGDGDGDNGISDEKESAGDTSHHDGRRKLTHQLSSASDESIYLKEPCCNRSGDEGALSSNEDTTSGAASLSFTDGKRSVSSSINAEEINRSPPVVSPFSEEQERNSNNSNHDERSSSVDSAIGFLGSRPLFSDGKFPPRILVGPSNIIALYGEVVHLRVKVQNYGIPKTAINWFKFINGTYKKIESSTAATAAGGDHQSTSSSATEDTHISISKCGASLSTLTITHINYDDCGRYRIKVQNLLGMDSHDCLLTVEGPPEPPTTPPKVKYDDKAKTILIQWSSCPYDGGSKITGYYVEASIVQSSKTAINKEDQDNWQLLTPQSYSWLCYTLTEPKRGSVYRFRVFGENIYGKGKPTEASLPLLVPILMEGRRAGSSDALLWSLKSLSQEETSLRADSKRNNTVHESVNEMTSTTEESASSQEEEEPVEYKNVTVRRESFHNVYEKLDELGKGRFGVVFEVVHKETRKSYAGKFVKCIKGKDKERVQLEVQIMNDLQYHPKLICLIDAFEMPREIVIVTQQINGGELFERVVADDFTLTEGDCIDFLRQICDAVGYIHTKNIMHLDLKPENILCTSKNSNSIKIIDFGLAQYHDPEDPIRVLFGTAEFVSPEIINYEPIAPSTDNWSIGVITYILLSGLSPFMGDNDNETFSNITKAEFDFDDEAFEQISEDAKDFISNLIVKRPEKRMTAEECLDHCWLKTSDEKKKVILPTDKLKRFLVRRKWQKTGNAIRALGRITTLYSSRRSSSTTSTPSGSISMSISSPPPPHSVVSPNSRSGSLVTQDSSASDYDNVFFGQKTPLSPISSGSPADNNYANSRNNNNANLAFNNNVNNSRLPRRISPLINSSTSATSTDDATTNRAKFTDPCRRSDSGVCDVGSFSSSLNYD